MAGTAKELSELLNKLDKPTKTFILDVGNSPLCWDLIYFYHTNPFTLHTCPSLAVFIGRRQDKIAAQIEHLVGLKVLTKISQGEDLLPIYAYEPSDFSRKAIKKLIQLTAGQKKQLTHLAKLVKTS